MPGCFKLNQSQTFDDDAWETASGWYQDDDDEGQFEMGPPADGHGATGPAPNDPPGNKYIYFDASGFSYKYVTITTCEAVPLGGKLTLKYVAYGADIGNFDVQVAKKDASGSVGAFETINTVIGDQGQAWKTLTITVGSKGEVGFLRLYYKNGRRADGDMTFDDVKYTPLAVVQSMSIITPSPTPTPTPTPTHTPKPTPTPKPSPVTPMDAQSEKKKKSFPWLLVILLIALLLCGCFIAAFFLAGKKKKQQQSQPLR